MAKSMKVVRNVMLNTLTDGGDGLQVPLSTNMAKVITPLAMQPMVAGMDINDIKDKTNPGLMEMKYTYFKIFYDFPVFYGGLCGLLCHPGGVDWLLLHQEDAW